MFVRLPPCAFGLLLDMLAKARLSSQQLVFREAFDKFDTDKDNSITRSELSRALQATGRGINIIVFDNVAFQSS